MELGERACPCMKGRRVDHGTFAVGPAYRVSLVLHEGVHLAITPGCFRALMDGNLFAGQREMLRMSVEGTGVRAR
jgi:hypothetical protein